MTKPVNKPANRLPRYVCVTSWEGPCLLNQRVNDLIAQGYQPIGGAGAVADQSDSVCLYQALWLPQEAAR